MATLESLSTADLASRCEAETARYRRGESFVDRFCLELFRRAIVLRDNASWTAVYTQYAEAVRRWLGLRTGEDDDAVAATFARFWRALDAGKFARFGSLAAILQYLKLCAHSARLDRARAARAAAVEEPLDAASLSLPAREDTESTVAARLDAAGFWRQVWDILSDDGEQLVVYLSYAIGLTPREIYARHAARFASVGEIYRLKRNALDRLRRSPELGLR